MGTCRFDCAAGCIIIFNLFLFNTRIRIYAPETRLFGALLICSLLSSVFDIFTVLLYEHSSSFSYNVHYLANSLFYFAHNTHPFLFTLFLLVISSTFPRTVFGKTLVCVPWSAAMVAITANPFTRYVFFFDDSLGYHRGPGLKLLYVIAGIYTVVSLTAIHIGRRRLPRATYWAILLFLPFSVVPIFIQLMHPDFLVQNFGISVSELLILLTIQDFRRFTERSSGLFNERGFVAQLRIWLDRGKKVTVFLLNMDATGYVRQTAGVRRFKEIENKLLTTVFGIPSVFRFSARSGTGSFALAVTHPADIPKERERLSAFLDAPVDIMGKPVTMTSVLCEITMPDDTADTGRIYQIQEKLVNSYGKYPGNTVLNLSDFSVADSGRQYAVALAIRNALKIGGLKVVYQPIVRTIDGKIVSAEALVRLSSPELGPVPPGEFIPIAEQNGSIHEIGMFVAREACRTLGRLRKEGLELEYIEINLSAAQSVDAGIVGRLRDTAREFDLGPADICLELTESAAHSSPVLMKRNLYELYNAGFRIAIDDFGTGFSNIETLMSIPFNTVKFDRDIIVRMDSSEKGKTDLAAIVELFRDLEVSLVAEGVETMEQQKKLEEMRFDLIQGYLYSRPIDEDAFIMKLAEGRIHAVVRV